MTTPLIKALIIASLDHCKVLLFICFQHSPASSTIQCILQTDTKVLFPKCKAHHDSRLIATLQCLPMSHSNVLSPSHPQSLKKSHSCRALDLPHCLAFLWSSRSRSEDRVPCVSRRVCLPLSLLVCIIKTVGMYNVKYALNKIYCLPSDSDISFQRHIMVKNNYPRRENPCLAYKLFLDRVPAVICGFISHCLPAHCVPCVPINSPC